VQEPSIDARTHCGRAFYSKSFFDVADYANITRLDITVVLVYYFEI